MPELTTEVLSAASAGLVVLLSGVWTYFTRLRTPPAPAASPLLQTIGAEFGNREQMERLIEAIEGVRDAILDKRTRGMEDYMKSMLDKMDTLVEDRQHRPRGDHPRPRR